MSDKFLFHLRQIRAAAQELPAAELWPNDEYIVELKSAKNSRLITFRRVPFASSSGSGTHKWVYEGKILVS